MMQWGAKLRDDLNIDAQSSNKLATTINAEITSLSNESKRLIVASSPVSLKSRLDEVRAFQQWMDYANKIRNNPNVVRAQVVTEIYICFVYLNESWFKVLRQKMDSQTTTKKCCKFLTDNPVRAFRNAIAHANWQYNSDCSGLEYWAKKGNDENEELLRFEVSDLELGFWQALSRCVAYASFLGLAQKNLM